VVPGERRLHPLPTDPPESTAGRLVVEQEVDQAREGRDVPGGRVQGRLAGEDADLVEIERDEWQAEGHVLEGYFSSIATPSGGSTTRSSLPFTSSVFPLVVAGATVAAVLPGEPALTSPLPNPAIIVI
jgi:hypothetical protein